MIFFNLNDLHIFWINREFVFWILIFSSVFERSTSKSLISSSSTTIISLSSSSPKSSWFWFWRGASSGALDSYSSTTWSSVPKRKWRRADVFKQAHISGSK